MQINEVSPKGNIFMIKMFAAVIGLFATATSVCASASVDSTNGVLIIGTEITKPYVKKMEVRVKGNARYTEMTPATYTLRNGIYLMPNGSCVERMTELEKIERLENGDGYIETLTLKEKATVASCPDNHE